MIRDISCLIVYCRNYYFGCITEWKIFKKPAYASIRAVLKTITFMYYKNFLKPFGVSISIAKKKIFKTICKVKIW